MKLHLLREGFPAAEPSIERLKFTKGGDAREDKERERRGFFDELQAEGLISTSLYEYELAIL